MHYFQFPYFFTPQQWLMITNNSILVQHKQSIKNQEKTVTLIQNDFPSSFKFFKSYQNDHQSSLSQEKFNDLAVQQIYQKNNNNKRIKKQNRKMTHQDEYTPNYKRKNKKNRLYQNQNRNILPNSIHQILSFIQKKSKSFFLLTRIFSYYEHDKKWTQQRFYLYVKKIQEKLNHYVSEDTLKLLLQIQQPFCQVYTESQQKFYLRVCRIMVTHFLREQSNVMILTSKRMHSQKRKQHMKVRRYLLSKVNIIFKSD